MLKLTGLTGYVGRTANEVAEEMERLISEAENGSKKK
jgi:hypothetical protein